MVVCTVGSCYLCGGSGGGMHWLGAGMIGFVEDGTGSYDVGGGWHDESKMAVNATSAVGMNGGRIGV